MYLCPICGNLLEDLFVSGIICPCCGNEAGFNDDILYEELGKFSNKDFEISKIKKEDLKKYDELEITRGKGISKEEAKQILKKEWEKYGAEIDKEFLHRYMEQPIPKEIAYKLLRAKWINNGCKWKWNDKNEKPNDWSMEKAKEQLENINININDYLIDYYESTKR